MVKIGGEGLYVLIVLAFLTLWIVLAYLGYSLVEWLFF